MEQLNELEAGDLYTTLKGADSIKLEDSQVSVVSPGQGDNLLLSVSCRGAQWPRTLIRGTAANHYSCVSCKSAACTHCKQLWEWQQQLLEQDSIVEPLADFSLRPEGYSLPITKMTSHATMMRPSSR